LSRLDKLIARNLGLSRRQVTKLFRAGRVRAEDGTRLKDPTQRTPESSLPLPIEVDGRACTLRDHHHVLQHRPVGVVTALRDAMHDTAYGLLQEEPLFSELRAVGRLDRDCSGLLLWTTDGDLVHRLAHPKYAVPREYHVALSAPFEPRPDELVLDDGHRPHILSLDPITEGDLHPALRRPADSRDFARIALIGGRFHEVKRIFAALGSSVTALARVRYGTVELPRDLEPGRSLDIDLPTIFRDLSPVRG
jgi:16S rRNA pseudouridine516 synthase